VGAMEASEDALGPEMELALSTSCVDAPTLGSFTYFVVNLVYRPKVKHIY